MIARVFETGDRVRVDVIGVPSPGFAQAPLGTVKSVDQARGLVGVALDETFEGEDFMLVSYERLRVAD